VGPGSVFIGQREQAIAEEVPNPAKDCIMALKKSELYSSLWSLCDELRGGMDASQYKDYVLVLLFIKYVSWARVASCTSTFPWCLRPIESALTHTPLRKGISYLAAWVQLIEMLL
jgi:hypothetical protein